MALLLNRSTRFLFIGIFAWTISFAQEDPGSVSRNTKDYKDSKEHEKFNKRCKIVGAWQINKLKEGALVVRLKTNKLLIDALHASGQEKLAKQTELVTYAVNKNTMFAYMDKFSFCNVYFVYSNLSDSLLHGARQGIFLDTNLTINPSIIMGENFYILAERDYSYNSSIGLVPEDSATKCVEAGNATRMMAVVLKNKYGHQLKSPMPWRILEKSSNASFSFPITAIENAEGPPNIFFYVNKNYLVDYYDKSKTGKGYSAGGHGNYRIELKKQETYEKISAAIEQLNENLREYLQRTPPPKASEITSEIRPFLY